MAGVIIYSGCSYFIYCLYHSCLSFTVNKDVCVCVCVCVCMCKPVCMSVRASRTTLLTQYLEKCWTYFSPNVQHWCTFGHWRMRQCLRSKGQGQGYGGDWSPTCWKYVHFLALLTRCPIENYCTEFHQTFSVERRWCIWGQGWSRPIKVKRSKVTAWTRAERAEAYRTRRCESSSNL